MSSGEGLNGQEEWGEREARECVALFDTVFSQPYPPGVRLPIVDCFFDARGAVVNWSFAASIHTYDGLRFELFRHFDVENKLILRSLVRRNRSDLETEPVLMICANTDSQLLAAICRAETGKNYYLDLKELADQALITTPSGQYLQSPAETMEEITEEPGLVSPHLFKEVLAEASAYSS